ncbi:chromate resistance protein ChrB domain-containing protein [Klebsiella pneumoniae]|nr:chromate resistance protein [Klebsiella pneumoniae]
MNLHVLILTLPTQQATLRMRVWRALKNTGAAMLRDGVYLLPEAQQSQEIFNDISREIRDEGGAAFVFNAATPEEEEIRPLFDRSQQYMTLLERLMECKNDLNEETAVSLLKVVRKLHRELDRIVAIDFFPGEAQAQAVFSLTELEAGINRFISPGEPHAVSGELTQLIPEDFHNRIWATRRRPWIDRLASAWLIRRFIDPDAQFLWLEDGNDCPAEAVGFDFDGATFSHIDNRVTFEVLMVRFGLTRDALNGLAMLIHFLDVGGVQPPEAVGVESVLAGLRESITDDDILLTAACSLFDGLLTTFEMRSGHDEQNGVADAGRGKR